MLFERLASFETLSELSAIRKCVLSSGHTGTAKTLRAYEGLELHPAIERAAGGLFHDGHYANAVEDAVKALNALVRLNSGVDDKDGSSLMEHIFSAPRIQF